MDDAWVSRQIDEAERDFIGDHLHEIERGLEVDDPEFVQRIHRLHRVEFVYTLTVSLLLIVGAVLITVGLATLSWPVWGCGVLAFVAMFAVDHCFHHIVR